MTVIKTLVIFGASGNLTSQKLIPALFELYCNGKLKGTYNIVGVSRTPMSGSLWRERLEESVAELRSRHDGKTEDRADNPPKSALPDEKRFRDLWRRFAEHLDYFPGDIHSDSTFIGLELFLRKLEGKETPTGESARCERIYYLALAPDAYEETVRRLGEAGMAKEDFHQKRRLMIEKPFGSSRISAENLTRALQRVFEESQIFRIDHYLGKETVNNIFVLRFANTVFEPLWNRHFIDHLQITANEETTVGRRGAFYDKTQVLRDMFQNHLLQLLAVTAMEAPVRFDAKSIRDEKVKVLSAVRRIRPTDAGDAVLFGQYDGYRSEKEVSPDSRTPTFAVMKLFIDNGRWRGVPIYLRSGKGTGCRTTQVVIQFKEPPCNLFRRLKETDSSTDSERDCQIIPEKTASSEQGEKGNLTDLFPNDANRLLIQIQPSEGIRLSFLTKVPGTEGQVRKSELTFSFRYGEGVGAEGGRHENAYERLFECAFQDDASLFARDDEITTAWEIIDPFLDWWESSADDDGGGTATKPLYPYPTGTWGPAASDTWMARDGKRWFNLCPVIRNG